MRKRVLLINPPRYEVWPTYFPERFARILGWSPAFFPGGLLRIGSYLREKGCTVSMVNAGGRIRSDEAAAQHRIGRRRAGNFQGKPQYSPLFHVGMPFDELRRRLSAQPAPDEIYVTSFFTYHWEAVHETLRICKEVFPAAKALLGGIYPTLCPEAARRSRADVVHVGELPATNHSRLALDLLEEPPDYIILKTSRGCPRRCSYCAVNLLEGSTMRYRPPEDVVDEIEEKARTYGIRAVAMWESNILIDAPNHLERILDALIRRGTGIRFSLPEGLDPTLLTPPLIEKLQRAGLDMLALSLETRSRETALHRFRAPHKLKAFRAAMSCARELGMFAYAFILGGLPGQDVEEVRGTVLEVLRAGSWAMLMPFTPIPGTEEYRRHQPRIAHKGLEELHPLLWPCVEDREDYERLCSLHGKCGPFLEGRVPDPTPEKLAEVIERS